MPIFVPFSVAQTPLDGDAARFLQVTGVTGQNEVFALNNLVQKLKYANLWTRYQIIYPFLGTTSTTQKFNLKNPLDTNAAYRISFVNGGTFNASGYTSDGVNDYANTNLIGTSMGAGLNDFSVSYYIKDNTVTGTFDMGTRNDTFWLASNFRNASGQFTARAFNNTFTGMTHSHTTGLATVSRAAAANFLMAVNDTSTTATQTSTGRPAFNLVFGAYNDFGTPGLFVNRNFQFFSVGNSITLAEHTTLWNIVAEYQANLNR
jgi:hypothetical protein